jgi:hypothetical protein
VQVDDAVGLCRDLPAVGRQKDGEPDFPRQGPNVGHQVFSLGGVQIAGRLIGQQDFRTVDDGAGQGRPLELASRKLGRKVVRAGCQTDAVQYFTGEPGSLPPGEPVQDKGQGHVFDRGQGGEEVEELIDDAQVPPAEPGQLPLGQRGDAFSLDAHLAAGRPVDPRHQVQQGALPAPAGSHQGDELSGGDRETDVAQRRYGLRLAIPRAARDFIHLCDPPEENHFSGCGRFHG